MSLSVILSMSTVSLVILSILLCHTLTASRSFQTMSYQVKTNHQSAVGNIWRKLGIHSNLMKIFDQIYPNGEEMHPNAPKPRDRRHEESVENAFNIVYDDLNPVHKFMRNCRNQTGVRRLQKRIPKDFYDLVY